MQPSPPLSPFRKAMVSFFSAIPIGTLGGLIGVGGAEYRLPVLVGLLRCSTRQAVTLNLAVSLVTVVTALITRMNVLQQFPLGEVWIVLLAMTSGAAAAASIGAKLAVKLSVQALERVILWWLVAIGSLLIIEAVFPFGAGELLHSPAVVQAAVGVIAGLLIGTASSMLGVAGGELIIPILIFIYGMGVKTAGTASLMISFPTILVGLARYAAAGQMFDWEAGRWIALPMAAGSIIGSVAGGMLVGLIAPEMLKLILGAALIGSAIRIFRHR